ncbi:MAG: response regulator transcription factor [Hydrogenovibrio sp.]
MEKLLLVEDEPGLVKNLTTKLKAAGYIVDVARDGREADFMLSEYDYDLMILDLGLPHKSGLAVLEDLRMAKNNLPILILTARNTWQERVEGLKKGADDYLGKPFHFEELLVRIQVLLKRPAEVQQSILHLDGLQLDLNLRQLTVGDKTIRLTKAEFTLLKTFFSQPFRVFSKSQLLQRLGDHTHEPESNVIEVYIRRLRQYLGKSAIETLRGQGYRFVGTTTTP